MNIREQCHNIINEVAENQLVYYVSFLRDLKRLYDEELEEAMDDAFCIALAERYDARANKDERGIPIEDLAAELGIVLGDENED